MVRRDQRINPKDAATLAHVVSAIMFLAMASAANITKTVEDLLLEIRDQVRVILPR
ncbi:hypothetical protein [Arthrobacter sp. 2MCAF14]|uniref:hypothetical protein n=1 Tax=Arthrobacter sp. 2MCAF14 TaxID=3232982 RepID=UPI003F906B41